MVDVFCTFREDWRKLHDCMHTDQVIIAVALLCVRILMETQKSNGESVGKI